MTSFVVLVRIFNSLRLVEHHQVEMDVGIANFVAIANDGFVIGDPDNIAAGPPQPLATARAAFDGRDR